MTEASTHIRIPVSLKNELDKIAEQEQRDRITVVTRFLTEAIANRKTTASV